MTYDQWKTAEPGDSPRPTKEWLVTEIAEIEKEIAWNEHRLEHLVFNEEDRQQTADYINDLRQERSKLLAVING